jgi:hypothetical protein
VVAFIPAPKIGFWGLWRFDKSRGSVAAAKICGKVCVVHACEFDTAAWALPQFDAAEA